MAREHAAPPRRARTGWAGASITGRGAEVRVLNRIPWLLLVPLALLLGLAPFGQEPHLVEKLRLLSAGELRRPIDIFDLLLHGGPLLLLLVKAGMALAARRRRGAPAG
jgi:hypothetical protein